jgi:hypothetical protein
MMNVYGRCSATLTIHMVTALHQEAVPLENRPECRAGVISAFHAPLS